MSENFTRSGSAQMAAIHLGSITEVSGSSVFHGDKLPPESGFRQVPGRHGNGATLTREYLSLFVGTIPAGRKVSEARRRLYDGRKTKGLVLDSTVYPFVGIRRSQPHKSKFFAISVAGAKDANNDGQDDAIAGTNFYNGGQSGEGAAFVYHGSASGPNAIFAWSPEGNQELALFGFLVLPFATGA